MTELDKVSGLDDLRGRFAAAIHAHWKLFLAEGIVLMVLGLLAIAVPEVASVAITIFIGWLFFIGGIFRAVSLVQHRDMPGLWLGVGDVAACDRSRSRIAASADCRGADPDFSADRILYPRRASQPFCWPSNTGGICRVGAGCYSAVCRFASRLLDLGWLAELGRLGDRPSRRHQHGVFPACR